MAVSHPFHRGNAHLVHGQAVAENGDMLVLETKGQNTEQDRVKIRYLDEWTQAVSAHGAFGRWASAVVRQPGKIRDILKMNRP